MTRRKLLVLIVSVGCLLLAAGVGSAQSTQSNLTVTYPSAFAVSPPSSQISRSALQPASPAGQRIVPLRPRPVVPGGALGLGVSPQDQALQSAVGGPLELEDEGGKPRFPGVGADGSAPPDPNLAVGPNHIVQIVNTEFAVYSKSGVIFPGYPQSIGSLFSALGGGCAGEWGDPIVQYDRAADRWLISQLGSFTTGLECIAVSRTNDPTGAYNLYSYNFGVNLNDYPKIGVWPTSTNSAYTATYNLFTASLLFVGSDLCVYDRAAMLAGATSPASVCFMILNDGGFLPSDWDGSTPPPAGSPSVFLNFETLSSLRYYQLSPNFANPNSSTLSGPTDIGVAAFSEACGGGTCIPQRGTSQQLDSLGDRLMYRLAYRNFGDHDALVVNHSVAAGGSVGVRWYELRSPLNGAFTLYQEGTFAPDSTYRWMGSAAMDQAGDIAIGYSASSSSLFPAIRYTGRAPGDALGTMRSENSLLEGTGSQTGNLSRWGDYTALRIDPSDDCTFWYTNQYEPSNGSFNWATWVGSFKFTNCGTASTPDFSVSGSPTSQSVVQGSSPSYTVMVTPSGGFTGTVNLQASVSPSGAGPATFNQPSIAITSSSAGSSTMSVTASSSTPPGTYTVTITATASGGSPSHNATVTLVVNAAATPDFSVSASPSSQTATPGNGTSYTATVTPSGSFSGSVTLSVSSGLPSGATATFSPNPITGGSGQSTMSVSTSTSTPAGTYTLTIRGASGNLSHTTSVTLVVSSGGTPGFSVSASPSSQTVTRGQSTTYTVTVTAINGFNGTVALRVRGLPFNSNASFNPSSVPGHGTSTLTVSTNSSTSTGTFTLRIRGTSGGVTHGANVQLVVH